MLIEIAALCDAATDQGGKLNLLGAFDRIGGPLPMVFPQCAAVFRIRWLRQDSGEHVMTLLFQDLRGIPLVPPLESKITVPPMPSEIDSHAINLMLNLQRLRIEHEGQYQLIFRVDGVDQTVLPLWVKDTTPHEPNPVKPEER